jgi:hypothetical protein
MCPQQDQGRRRQHPLYQFVYILGRDNTARNAPQTAPPTHTPTTLRTRGLLVTGGDQKHLPRLCSPLPQWSSSPAWYRGPTSHTHTTCGQQSDIAQCFPPHTTPHNNNHQARHLQVATVRAGLGCTTTAPVAHVLQGRNRWHTTKSARQGGAACISDGVPFQPDNITVPHASSFAHCHSRMSPSLPSA